MCSLPFPHGIALQPHLASNQLALKVSHNVTLGQVVDANRARSLPRHSSSSSMLQAQPAAKERRPRAVSSRKKLLSSM